MFFESWEKLLKILIVGSFSYLGLVILLRIAGKRTLTQLTTVDFIGTVALGSILANAVIFQEITLVDAVVSFALLIFFQITAGWLTRKFRAFEKVAHDRPRLLYYNGIYHEPAMEEEKIAKEEVLHAMREKGFIAIEDVSAVVLEINGMFSVLPNSKAGTQSALENVRKD
jgi:uncharacterized membrane protein YcaP (DUF421 family)